MSDQEKGEPSSAERPRREDWPLMVEWAEKQGHASLVSRFATAELIAKETQTTLTVLLAGIGGSAAYGAKVFEAGAAGPIPIAATAACVYLTILAIFLVLRCMMFQSYPALYQDPKNLLHPTYSLTEVREAELDNLHDRICEASAINRKRAKRLNVVRLSAALSPLVFLIAGAVAPPQGLPNDGSVAATCQVNAANLEGIAVVNCVISK